MAELFAKWWEDISVKYAERNIYKLEVKMNEGRKDFNRYFISYFLFFNKFRYKYKLKVILLMNCITGQKGQFLCINRHC